MSRLFYRCLIRLHPREFRERFGDQMLCVFDEASDTDGAAAFLTDGVASLARQWLERSSLWRWAVGAGLTALLIVSVAHSEGKGLRNDEIQSAAQQKSPRPLDHAEFNREAAQAVAMLARFRTADRKKSHPRHSRQSALDEPAQD